MSAHVLLIIINELGKRDKMRGFSSILSHFRNEFNTFNNTGARKLDSIYHMTLSRLPNGQMPNRWLSEKNNSSVFELRFRGAKKGKQMLHVLFIIISISCPRERIKIGGCHATFYGSLRLCCK